MIMIGQGCQGQVCQGQDCQSQGQGCHDQGCQGCHSQGCQRQGVRVVRVRVVRVRVVRVRVVRIRTIPVGSGRWDWFMEACHRGERHWLDRARGVIHGGMRHWLGRGDWIASWGHAMGHTTQAGSGVGIESWGLAMGTRGTCWIKAMGLIYGGVWHWLERGDGNDSWGLTIGNVTVAGSGWWDWFIGVRHGGVQHGLDRGDCIDLWGCAIMRHGGVRLDRVMRLIVGVALWGRATLAGSGRWDWFMGACYIGWTGAMGLIHGGMPWGHATLAGSGRWDWYIGVRHGGVWTWLDRGDGFDWWGLATLAGPGRWVWFMGVRDTGWNGGWHWFMGTHHGGVQLDQGDGIDLCGHAMGCDTGWMWAIGLSYGGVPWGRTTGSGWWMWNWFVGESHRGARHWLDLGDGVDLCGRTMGVRDTGWIRAMGLIHGDVPNDKIIWLLNLNDDTMCPHVWRWGKCAECVWLRGW